MFEKFKKTKGYQIIDSLGWLIVGIIGIAALGIGIYSEILDSTNCNIFVIIFNIFSILLLLFLFICFLYVIYEYSKELIKFFRNK